MSTERPPSTDCRFRRAILLFLLLLWVLVPVILLAEGGACNTSRPDYSTSFVGPGSASSVTDGGRVSIAIQGFSNYNLFKVKKLPAVDPAQDAANLVVTLGKIVSGMIVPIGQPVTIPWNGTGEYDLKPYISRAAGAWPSGPGPYPVSFTLTNPTGGPSFRCVGVYFYLDHLDDICPPPKTPPTITKADIAPWGLRYVSTAVLRYASNRCCYSNFGRNSS